MTEPIEEAQSNLDKGQKIGVVLLVCITLLLVGVAIVQFNSSIRSYGKRVASGDAAPTLDANDRAKEQQAALKKVDTDSDGLSDYDEIYIYHTSPYIRDTDSDSIPDGEEVRRGTSPVCPEGKDCSIDQVVAANNNATSTDAAVPTFQTSQQAGGSVSSIVIPAAAGAPADQQNSDISKIAPAELRALLISKGVPKEKLDTLSDKDLMDFIKQAQSESASPAPASGATPTP